MDKLVTFISVNYNGLDTTREMILSVLDKIHSCKWEMVVVDNGSEKDEASLLRVEFPQIKFIRSEENLGFAGGNNLALPHANGDFLFFINNDTEFLDDNVDKLCQALDTHPEAGMVCPKIRFYFDKDVIQYAGYTPMHGFRMRNDMIGWGQKDDGSFDKPGFTSFPNGAAMMVRRKALEDAGPVPEMYFLYYEELDWANTFARKNWKIYFEPACVIYHKDSMTTRRHGPVFSYYMTRSRLIYAWRNLSGRERVLSILFTRFVATPKAFLLNLLHGRFDSAKSVIKANADFIRMIKEGKI